MVSSLEEWEIAHTRRGRLHQHSVVSLDWGSSSSSARLAKEDRTFQQWLAKSQGSNLSLAAGREIPSIACVVQPGNNGGFQKLFFGREEIAIPVQGRQATLDSLHDVCVCCLKQTTVQQGQGVICALTDLLIVQYSTGNQEVPVSRCLHQLCLLQKVSFNAQTTPFIGKCFTLVNANLACHRMH